MWPTMMRKERSMSTTMLSYQKTPGESFYAHHYLCKCTCHHPAIGRPVGASPPIAGFTIHLHMCKECRDHPLGAFMRGASMSCAFLSRSLSSPMQRPYDLRCRLYATARAAIPSKAASRLIAMRTPILQTRIFACCESKHESMCLHLTTEQSFAQACL